MAETEDVSVIVVGRIGSTRCPQKIVRDFVDGLSLFEITCNMLKSVNHPVYAGIGEQELVSIAEEARVPIIFRSQDEITAHSPLRRVFKCVEQIKTKYAMLISPCTPFLRAETVNRACETLLNSKEHYQSLSSATIEQNWFFDREMRPLFPINVHNMTSNDLRIYALAGAFEAFPVKRFLEEGIYYTFADPTDPYLFEISKKEAIDINSEEEFRLAASTWRHEHGENV